VWPSHERHRTHWFQHGSEQPAVRTSSDDGARAVARIERGHSIGRRPIRPPDLSSPAGDVTKDRVDGLQRFRVVERPVDKHRRPPSARLARLVDEQHRNVVSHRVRQSTSGAHELTGRVVNPKLCPTGWTGKYFEQAGIQIHG
jgi:hypothetical protein